MAADLSGARCDASLIVEVGKANILALNPDGSGQRVCAAGLRNPVSIAFDPRTNEL